MKIVFVMHSILLELEFRCVWTEEVITVMSCLTRYSFDGISLLRYLCYVNFFFIKFCFSDANFELFAKNNMCIL